MRKLFPYPSFIVFGCIILFANCKKGQDVPAPAYHSIFDSVAKLNGRWAVSGAVSYPKYVFSIDSTHTTYLLATSTSFADNITITATADSGAAIRIIGGNRKDPNWDSVKFEGTLPFQRHNASSHVLMYGTISDPNSVRSGENRFLYYYYLENKFFFNYSRWLDTSTTVSAHIDVVNKL